jgi:hypothetical protein
MADLDLSDFLKDASIADLSWLDVDEARYRAESAVPKQNLDVKPDLEALWGRDGESAASYFVPNVVPVPDFGIKDPHTMGDMSEVHGKLRARPEDIIRSRSEAIAKVARLAMMQSDDLGRVREELVKRYPLETLNQHREVLASVLQERGLVGRYYVVAEDFAGVNEKKATAFINKYAPNSRFVLSKTACGGCASCRCSQPAEDAKHTQFNRELVTEVPYSDKQAARIEQQQAARGRIVQASAVSAKERIRNAFLAPRPERSEVYAGYGVNQHKPKLPTPAQAREQLIQTSSLVRNKRAQDQSVVDARPVVDFLHREMVKGLSHGEITASLKLAFDKNLLLRTHEVWGRLLRESGLYGVVYTKQASFADCHEGADFLAKHNPSVRAIVAGEKCGSCVYSKQRCLLYGKPLVKKASEVVTQATVDAVLTEHRLAGRLPAWSNKTAASWGETPARALKAIHEAVRSTAAEPTQTPQSRLGAMTGFYGNTPEYAPSGVARKEIVKQASRYMNEGLYGSDLVTALKSRFDPRDIIASKGELRTVIAEQGLQGVYYVDPAVYDDYGKGCDEASRLHSSRGVPYLKYGSKCTSCVHQTKIGHCSKINKPLVAEPPYANKLAQQRAVLASGQSTSISYADLVNNGASMMDEYHMQNDMVVDVQAAEAPRDVTIMFGQGKIKL